MPGFFCRLDLGRTDEKETNHFALREAISVKSLAYMHVYDRASLAIVGGN